MQSQLNTNNPTAVINPDDVELSFTWTDSGNAFDKYYDDGYGPLWLYRDASGLVCIIRARNESAAYEIMLDEFAREVADEDIPEAYGAWDKLRDALIAKGHEDTYHLRSFCSSYASLYFEMATYDANNRGAWDNWELQEGYQYAPNGPRETNGSGIRSIDLNGEALEPLTVELLERIGLTLHVSMQ